MRITTYQSFAMVLFAAVGVTDAAELPTELDLKAAYCIKIAQSQVQKVQGLVATFPSNAPAESKRLMDEQVREIEDRLNRLQLYLAPRMAALDSLALLAATKRGEVDWSTLNEIAPRIQEKCTAECRRPNGKGADTKCLAACGGIEPLVARIGSCSDVNWLPF